MLRISDISTTPDVTRLRLEGQVTGAWVGELRRVCAGVIGNNGHPQGRLLLDITGLSFLDVEGVGLFRELAQQQVIFLNGSPFIAEQLKGVADVNR
jgi:anti-anti-sigma regulatory factor